MDVSRDCAEIMFTHSEEVKMLSVLIGLNENSIFVLKIIGFLEIIGVLCGCCHFKNEKLFILHIIMLIGLTYSGRIDEYR